jgi:PAS domain S-box-containing protein
MTKKGTQQPHHDPEQSAKGPEQEADFIAVQRIAGIGYWVNNLQTDDLFWSEEIFRLFGRDRQSIDSMNIMDWVHPDDRESFGNAAEAYVREKSKMDTECRVVWPDGSIHWLHSRGEVICDDEGNVIKTMGMVQDITERKETEATLRESEARLNETQRLAQIGHWVSDVQTETTYWSKEMYRLFGADQRGITEISKGVVTEWIHPDDHESWSTALTTYVQEKTMLDHEYRILWPDGTIRWLHGRGEAVYNAAGESIKAIGMVQDITEQKRIEAELREKESRLIEAQRISHIGSWVTNLQTEEIYWSDELFSIYGVSKQELGRVKILDWVHPDDRKAGREAIESYTRGDSKLDFECRIIRPDGEMHWIHNRGELVYDENGQPLKTLGTVQDITERKRIEADNRLFRLFADLSGQGVSMATLEGVTTYVNPAFQKMVGISNPEEAINVPILDYYPESAHEYMQKVVIPQVFEEGQWTDESVMSFQGGPEVPVIENIYLIYDERGNPLNLANIVIDISEQKQIEAEREQLQRAVIDAQKNALRELSTPIIPVMDNIIIVPLIGSVDSARSQDVMRALLSGISEHRAKVVILDITGVPVVDTGVADYLNKTIQAARLKGSHTIVTGVSDAVAETIVDLGIDWGDIETLRDLQTGLVTAINRLGIRFG